MSAAVCGSKRSFFEEQLPPSPPLSKRLRCSSSTSPIRFPTIPSLFDQLRNLFPHMDQLVLERALQECDNDLDAAIKSLNEFYLGAAGGNSGTAEESEIDVNVDAGKLENDGNASASENQSTLNSLPADGAEWIDFFVREMMVATSVDDARARAARMLEVLEKSISERARAEATDALQKENLMLKEQIEVLIKEKNSFKNAFRIQHERLFDYDNKNQELQHLKQLASQYQEQIRTLEMNNYALAMHLKHAQQSNGFQGHFPPDIF
uniref:CUE domain-containing protein n=1 Tax=Medicago truncatula TaxID=3880 RepID=I3S0H1_MEDTR|nr:unknown [Medicago truncatula]